MIKLTRIDRTKNMHRFYALQLGFTLFGDCVLIAEWGRLGAAGRVQEQAFPSLAQAQTALSQRLSVKIRRGYTVTTV
jgi:predicted DNA-binding WGR domain protein